MTARFTETRRFRQGAVMACLLLSASVVFTGCGKSVKVQKPVPVKGVVLFKGKPLANAMVSFYTKDASMPASGRSNDAGEFELTMFKKGDGALVGENTVTVSVFDVDQTFSSTPDPTKLADGKAGSLPDLTQRRTKAAGNKQVIPKEYSDTINTPLKHTVKPGGDTNVKLELN